MSDGNQLSVEYVDMTPTQYALWRQQLAALFAYVESIDLAATVSVADSRTGAIHNQHVPLSAD